MNAVKEIKNGQYIWAVVTDDGVPTHGEVMAVNGVVKMRSLRTARLYEVEPSAVSVRPPVTVGQTVWAIVTADNVPTEGVVDSITDAGIVLKSKRTGKTYDVPDGDIHFTASNAWNYATQRRASARQQMGTQRRTPVKTICDGFSVINDGDWTWIEFGEKPDEVTRTAIKNAFQAQWSKKRQMWYIKAEIKAEAIKAVLTAPQEHQPEAPDSVRLECAGQAVMVTHDRDWTWLSFEVAPPQSVIERLADKFGARWSRRRAAWYITETVEFEALAALFA
ncbi:MAG: hypothetical protein FOGNACKC_00799 [Anaerolineae bacterium]|nr:hypothetical protein [Anaerolineae bacterium]